MIEFVLLATIISLIVLIAYTEKINQEEKDKLVNALIAKNATELRDLTAADKIKVEETKPTPPAMIPMDSLDDEEWEKQVTKNL